MSYTKSARKSFHDRQADDLRALTFFTKVAHYFLAVLLALAGHLAHEHLLVSHFPVSHPHDLHEEHDVQHLTEAVPAFRREPLFLCVFADDDVVPSTFLSAQQLLFLLLSAVAQFCLTHVAWCVLPLFTLWAKVCEPQPMAASMTRVIKAFFIFNPFSF